MQDKVMYMHLFITCAILSQGIVGTFLKDNIEESSNVLVREKRVINRTPGEDVPVKVGDVPYIVNIKKANRVHCMGTVLSHYTVITAARCMTFELSVYTVRAGSIYSQIGTIHNVTNVKMHGHHPSRSSTFLTGIALITVNPPFRYRLVTNKIDLHTGPVLAGMHGTVSGFGSYLYGGQCESQHSTKLRSIIVPIMRHQECKNIYRDLFPITDEDICTYHPQRQCAHTDSGAPLIIENELAGVFIGAIDTAGRTFPSIKPDIFVLLQHMEYGPWIRSNIVV